jgi:hypothetical protein
MGKNIKKLFNAYSGELDNLLNKSAEVVRKNFTE